jgi:hypothetical protein
MAAGRRHLRPEEDPAVHHHPYSHYGIGMPLLLPAFVPWRRWGPGS